MLTVWYIKGDLAGTFAQMPETDAQDLADSGLAQICDGITPLKFPENHPNYRPPRGRPRKSKQRDTAPENK